MIIKKAVFDGSYQYEKTCPETGLPEFAFIGRSNVGKSSLINMLCDQKGLAKVSQSPGKTQTINFFTVDENWYLVDLLGYGYAKVSKTSRAEWAKMINYYLRQRPNLTRVGSVTSILLYSGRSKMWRAWYSAPRVSSI